MLNNYFILWMVFMNIGFLKFTVSELIKDGVVISWDTSMMLEREETKNLSFSSSAPTPCDVFLYLNTSHVHGSTNVTIKYNSHVLFPVNETESKVEISGVSVGQAVLTVNKTHSNCDVSLVVNSTIHIFVVHSFTLSVIVEVIGWMYFVAWSISFYPQVYLNFRRKSVVGLNFDFLAYNITGFTAYGIYNIGLFWIPEIQTEYFIKHPDGVSPVLLNDVFFTIHAVALTSIVIIQAFIYERGGQKLSKIAIILLSTALLSVLILLIVAGVGKIDWLLFINILSYLKLGVTLIKYIPQALMNYRRRSTEGWSIGNVLLDFTGGALSILQMILQSYNNDEWDLVFGDPTKFGLGFFSVLFDVLFIVQHYVLYRPKKGNMIAEPLLNSETE